MGVVLHLLDGCGAPQGVRSGHLIFPGFYLLSGSLFMKRKGNRVVVITGASSGFGRGAALRFAKAGDNVVIAARRESLLEDVAEQCRKAGVEALAVEADVSSAADVERLAEKALNEFGRIDVWVNNAGVGTVARFDEAPLEEHEQVIRTNLLGTIYGSYAALNQFRKQRQGVLI